MIDCSEIKLPYGDPAANTPANACRTTRYKTAEAQDNPDGKWQISRECANLDDECNGVGDAYHCEEGERPDGAIVIYDTCVEHDGCNSASGISISIVAAIAAITIALIS